MPKMTLLDMTQDILSAMDSDEVNSIGDTVESMQVAQAVKTCFYEMYGNLEIPEQQRLGQLQSLSDINRPNYLAIPDDVKEIYWIKYDYHVNGVTTYTDIMGIDNEQFLDMVTKYRVEGSFNDFANNDTNDGFIDTETFQEGGNVTFEPSASLTLVTEPHTGIRMWIENNRMPRYWTTFDNENIVFDAWDSGLESTLQGVNSMTKLQVDPPWEMADEFIPAISANMFPGLVAEAKAYCFVNYKQITNGKAEQQSRRQLSRMQNDFWRANQRDTRAVPNFGRRGPLLASRKS